MKRRYEIVMAGIGGQGVLTAGRLLAEAAVNQYEHVTWMSSYRAARRGGSSECTVILSDQEIASFLLSTVDAVLVMASSQLGAFLSRVKPGGLLIYEPSGLEIGIERQDIRIVPLKAFDLAKEIGAVQSGNMIFLGAYVGMTGCMPEELMREKMNGQFKGKALDLNMKAFGKGLQIGKKKKG